MCSSAQENLDNMHFCDQIIINSYHYYDVSLILYLIYVAF